MGAPETEWHVDEWHKMLAVALWKMGLHTMTITMEDMNAFGLCYPGTILILLESSDDGVTVSLASSVTHLTRNES